MIAAYLVLFAAVLVRHAMKMGYVSGRHTLTLVIVSVPWAAAGIWVCARRLAEKRGWSDRLARTIGVSALAASDRRRGRVPGEAGASEPMGALGGGTLVADALRARRGGARHEGLGGLRLGTAEL